MLAHIRASIVVLLTMTVVTGIIYPLAVTGIAQLIAPSAANGSLVVSGGEILGSSLIGQNWTSDRYFHGRPSAAGAGYDALASSGSNLGPTSQKLMNRIAADLKAMNADGGKKVPADAVTASGSGLDPHISPAYAEIQVARVAKARGLDEAKVRDALAKATELPFIGVFGQPRVNVFLLNLSLDGVDSASNG